MLLFVGIPLFFLELSFGQYASEGPVTIWKVSPIFTGIGYAMFLMSGLVGIYYNMILAWAMFYLLSSFSTTLPWASCDNWWNTDGKTIYMNCNSTINNIFFLYLSNDWNQYHINKIWYLRYGIWKKSKTIISTVIACRKFDTKNCSTHDGLVIANGSCILRSSVTDEVWNETLARKDNTRMASDEYFQYVLIVFQIDVILILFSIAISFLESQKVSMTLEGLESNLLYVSLYVGA